MERQNLSSENKGGPEHAVEVNATTALTGSHNDMTTFVTNQVDIPDQTTCTLDNVSCPGKFIRLTNT